MAGAAPAPAAFLRLPHLPKLLLQTEDSPLVADLPQTLLEEAAAGRVHAAVHPRGCGEAWGRCRRRHGAAAAASARGRGRDGPCNTPGPPPPAAPTHTAATRWPSRCASAW